MSVMALGGGRGEAPRRPGARDTPSVLSLLTPTGTTGPIGPSRETRPQGTSRRLLASMPSNGRVGNAPALSRDHLSQSNGLLPK